MIRCGVDLRDSRRAESLLRAAATEIERRCPRLTLDLGETHRADSRLIAVVIAIAQHARRAGVAFEVRASEFVRELVALYHAESAITFAPATRTLADDLSAAA